MGCLFKDLFTSHAILSSFYKFHLILLRNIYFMGQWCPNFEGNSRERQSPKSEMRGRSPEKLAPENNGHLENLANYDVTAQPTRA